MIKHSSSIFFIQGDFDVKITATAAASTDSAGLCESGCFHCQTESCSVDNVQDRDFAVAYVAYVEGENAASLVEITADNFKCIEALDSDVLTKS